jgi:hypothetical protein
MKKTVMQYLREQDKVTIKVDPKDMSAIKQAQKVAAATDSDIELKKEQNGVGSVNLSTVAKELRGLMEEALRQSGMEVSVSGIEDVTKDSFNITIEHPNENVETYRFTVDSINMLSISSEDYLGGEVVELGEVGVKASGEPIVNREIIKSELVNYFSATPLSTDPDAETDLAALKNYDDVEAGITEDDYTTGVVSIGHVDDEAGMMKQAAAEIVQYGQTLYDLFTHYEQTGDHVDFPHWFQSLIVRSRDYVGKASHYLEFETHDMPQQDPTEKLRSLYNTAADLERSGKLTLEQKQKIQKIISSYKK